MSEELITRIKFRKGDLEIDISGPNKDFVREQFKKILEIQKEISFTKKNLEKEECFNMEDKKNIEKKGIENFSKVCGISFDEIKNIYDFDKSYTNIHKIIPGKDPDRQRELALLTLIADLEVFGEEKKSGKALSKNMKEQKVNSMSHLAQNLKSENGISMIDNYYRLNTIGRNKAIELVKKYCVMKNE